MLRPPLAFVVVFAVALSGGCGKQSTTPSEKAAVQALKPAKLPPIDQLRRGLDVPAAATLLDAATLSTAVTQGTLDAVRARIDELTRAAADAVSRIEERPPTQAELIELNALFDDTKRALMTDTQLAAQGLRLDAPARAAVARYTKRSHQQLLQRLAAAGRRHRARSK